MATRTLLSAYRSSDAFPHLGVAVRLNMRALRKIEALCGTQYTECVSIVMRGFVRFPSLDPLLDDTANVDIRVMLVDNQGAEVMNDYTLICRYQPLQRSFEVMSVS